MKRVNRWIFLIGGLATVFVTVSAIVQAVRQGSWEPVISVAWIPAVIVATGRGTYRCRLPRRSDPAS